MLTGVQQPGSRQMQFDPQLDVQGCVFDIKRYAIHDGPGIRTTVFFKGCPLKCRWCHNPESWRPDPEPGIRRARCIRCGRCVEACASGAVSIVEGQPVTDPTICTLCGECIGACSAGAREVIGRQMAAAEVMDEIERDVIFYDTSGGGATFSGGEPLAQSEFLLAMLDMCRQRQVHTAVDTSCYSPPEVIDAVAERANLFLCDLKHMDTNVHERFTGVGNSLILDNIRRISQAGREIIIRFPIIPGFNDDAGNIDATAAFAASLPNVSCIDILPYNRGGVEKSERLAWGIEIAQAETPDRDKVKSIAERLNDCGLKVRIGG